MINDIFGFLLLTSIANLGILVLMYLMFTFANDFLYRRHFTFFKVSKEQFKETYYSLLQFGKFTVIAFNIVPCVVTGLAMAMMD